MKRNQFIFHACFLILCLSFSWSCTKTDPTNAIIKHTKSMLKIITDNKDDCEKLVNELQAYSDNHKEDFKKLQSQVEKMEADMTDEQKNKYQTETIKKLSSTMQESMAAIMEISRKCPEKAARIGTLMNLDSINTNK